MQIAQQHLAPQLLPVLSEDHANELAGAGDLALAHAADEQVALPVSGSEPVSNAMPDSAIDGTHTM